MTAIVSLVEMVVYVRVIQRGIEILCVKSVVITASADRALPLLRPCIRTTSLQQGRQHGTLIDEVRKHCKMGRSC